MIPFYSDWKQVPKSADRANKSVSIGFTEKQAARIRDYWRRHGFEIDIEVMPASGKDGREPIHIIKSNLINGLPPNVKVSWS